MKQEKLNLKFLIRAHTIVGLACLFLFYISSYFGAFTLLLPYIKTWELPSKHIQHTYEHQFNIDTHLPQIIQEQNFLTQNIEITLPTFKDPRLQISAQNQNTVFLNPNTNEILTLNNEQDTISNFFNLVHFGSNIPIFGQPLMGLASIATLFLILSGVLLYFKNKKKAHPKEKPSFKKKWVTWHKYLGFYLTPFVLIFTLTGAFLGFMLYSSTPFALSSSNFEEKNIRKLVGPTLFNKKALLPKSSEKVQTIPFSKLYEKAQANYPELFIDKVNIYNYNQENSQTVFSGHLKNNRMLTSRINRVWITLDSHNAKVLEKIDFEQTHVMKKVMSGFYFFHFLTDETLLLRLLFFILTLGLITTLVLGYMIWAEKSIKHRHEPHYFSVMNRLSIAVMIGVIPASAFVVFLHWLLPFDVYDREIWIKGCFYALWSFTCFYSIYEENITKVIKRLLMASSVLFILAVLLHGLKMNLYPWQSFQEELWVIFGVDMLFTLLALLLFIAAKTVDKFKFFNRFSQEEIYHYGR